METEIEEPAPNAPVGDTPAPSEYAGLKVADLKEKLREQELPVSGTKAELLARLEEAGVGGGETAKAAIDYSELSQKELKAHRKEVNEAAEVLRIKRDEMNLESQSHAAERNELNNEAKVQMEQVQYQRTLRNGLNFDVSQVRDERREVLDEVDQLREQFLSLKRARFSGTHLPPSRSSAANPGAGNQANDQLDEHQERARARRENRRAANADYHAGRDDGW